MKKSTKLIPALLAFSMIAPTHLLANSDKILSYNIYGLGAIGGAALGILYYKTMASEVSSPKNKDHKKPLLKKSNLETFKSYLPLAGYALTGALVGSSAAYVIFQQYANLIEQITEEQRTRDENRLARERAQEEYLQAQRVNQPGREHLAQAQLLIRQANEMIPPLTQSAMNNNNTLEETAFQNIEQTEQYLRDAEEICNRTRNMTGISQNLLNLAQTYQREIETIRNLLNTLRNRFRNSGN